MVGTMMLLKMLHCKLKRRKKENTKGDVLPGTSREKSSPEVTVKVEQVECDEQYICRVCLKEGSVPIYGYSGFDDICDSLNTFGGILVSPDDGYPKYLCQSCNALLQGAILFRRTAQESEQVLRQRSQDTIVSEDSMPLDNEDDISNNTDDDNNMSFNCQVEKVEFDEVKEKQMGYHCKKCDQNFQTQKEYTNHRLSEEHENMRETCKICNNTYSTAYFRKHLALHKCETPYMCDICGKNFIIQGQFTRHRLTHFYNLPFKCSVCPYRGRFSESLKMHMRSHTGEKPYQCPQCPSRSFVNKSNLNKHMLTHKGDHDFKCSQCQRGFYTKRDLDLHFKVDHSGIKDHVCNVCGKAFGYRKQMMKHQLKVHKREKLRSGRMPLYMIVDKKRAVEDN